MVQAFRDGDAVPTRLSRHLDWDGCFNTRDVGGLTTVDGGRLRPGALVRSDSVDKLTSAGWAALWAYGIRTVVDLRNEAEWGADTSVRPLGLTTVHVALDDAEDTEFWDELNREVLNGSPLYYRPFLNRKPGRVAAAITAVAHAGPGGVLVHCAAGRDRTGLVTTVLLAVAGVRPDEIADDNELSTERVRRLNAAIGMADDTPEIQAALARRHTSVRGEVLALLDGFDADAYLRSAGVAAEDLESIRRRLGVSDGVAPSAGGA